MTIDAMACQTKIAKAIMSKGGDDLLAVKGNQGKLAVAIQASFTPHHRAPIDRDTSQIEKQKSLVEARTHRASAWVIFFCSICATHNLNCSGDASV
ncbi:hypothetical protein EDI29_02325 [Pectobacterium polonicum]|nr:hypothetical protein EDI29_02325 [Pectobacterium polonicum]